MVQRLAILTTHPIQYNAPFFKGLSQSGKVAVKVFYTWDKGAGQKHDPGFGKQIEWDIPLLEGYNYIFVKNTSKDPGSHHFRGIQNPTLIDEIKNYRPDAILVYGWSFQSHLKAMRYFKGKIPVWFRGDSHLLDETPGIKTILRRSLLKLIYTHIDKAFYVGINNKAYYVVHGLKEEQLVYMPHVVDNDFFTHDYETCENKAIEWRKNLGIKPNDFAILYAGKFEPVKNLELLIKAVIEINENRFLKTNDKQINLILVGNGLLEQRLRIMAEGRKYILFLPFQNQSQMPVVYRLGNVFCLPSKSETWGLGANEALACGRKSIVSDKVGCTPDLINNKTGSTFSNNDEISLSKAIITLYQAKTKLIGTSLLPENFTILSNVNILNHFCH